jgi:hypothetical protein
MDSFSVEYGLMAGCCVQCYCDQHRESGGYHGTVTITFLRLLVGNMGLHECRCLWPLVPFPFFHLLKEITQCMGR